VPTAIWDSSIIAWFRGWLWSYVQFNGKNKKDDGDNKDIKDLAGAADSSDSSFRNANEQKSKQGV